MPCATMRSFGLMGGILDADKNLVWAGSVGLVNVDALKTVDRVAKSCELNSTHWVLPLNQGKARSRSADSQAAAGGMSRPWPDRPRSCARGCTSVLLDAMAPQQAPDSRAPAPGTTGSRLSKRNKGSQSGLALIFIERPTVWQARGKLSPRFFSLCIDPTVDTRL
jgi:hypothetical protein